MGNYDEWTSKFTFVFGGECMKRFNYFRKGRCSENVAIEFTKLSYQESALEGITTALERIAARLEDIGGNMVTPEVGAALEGLSGLPDAISCIADTIDPAANLGGD